MLAGVIFLQYLKSQTFFILRLQLMQKEVPKTSVYIRVPINHMCIGPNLVYHISISSFFFFGEQLYRLFFSEQRLILSDDVTISDAGGSEKSWSGAFGNVEVRNFLPTRTKDESESWGRSKEDCRLIVDDHQSIFIGVVLYI